MDPDNPVVKLCAAGMQAEAQGRLDEARELFRQAWAARRDDFEACVAAHYLARHQERPEEVLHWNQAALNYADAVADERVKDFYPSLYLNLGWAYEMLDNRAEANRYYVLAADCLDDLPAGPYRVMVEDGVRRGRERMA